MLCYIILLFSLWSHLLFITLAAKNDQTEYCPLDTFQPICSEDEVTVIQHAFYGRIRVGRCIQTDYLLGCSVDVLNTLDKMCSGQRSCSISIPNNEMIQTLDCLDMSLRASAYLEASYQCQKVYLPRATRCQAPQRIQVSRQYGYIASAVSKDTSCGLHGSPWILTADPGQQIEISLVDFSWNKEVGNPCPINYGYILDMESDDVINICGGTLREKLVYTSPEHSVQIVLEASALERNGFLLKFKALGCPQYKPPLHSWIQQENESLVIGCVSSEKYRKVKCMDNRWIGIVGNCTAPPLPVTEETGQSDEWDTPIIKSEKSSSSVPHISNNHVIVFTTACLTVLSCCVIIILGVYFIKRYDVKIKKYKKTDYNTTASFKNGNLTLGQITTYKPVMNQHTGTVRPPAYTFSMPKKEHGPQVPPRNSTSNSNPIHHNGLSNENNTYENLTGDNESVQYYVLENPAENGC